MLDLLQAVLSTLSAAGGGVLDNIMFVKDGCWAFQAMSWRTSETKGNSHSLLCIMSKEDLQIQLFKELCCCVLRKIL